MTTMGKANHKRSIYSRIFGNGRTDRMELQGKIDAIDKSQAVIEFNMDGTILTANENFLNVVGYSLGEIEGRHHRMFCEPAYANSPEYKAFWEKLNRGEFDAGEYRRFGKGGQEAWIQATYNPIAGSNGNPYKVVKFATDVTAQKLKNAEFEGKMEAIGKSQAVIEFNMDGTIITANENFLNVVGYSLDEIEGQHHRMFCEPAYASSPEYKAFWEKLNRGEFESGEFKRLGKGDQEAWIQATYNPIGDSTGKPFKVVKFATDVTAQKLKNAEFEGKMEAIGKSQAIIEFNMDGTIVTANENFLNVVGYSLSEIQGQHHRMFCEPTYASGPEYKAFWEKLNRGEFESGEFKRLGKGGKEAWLQASYNPIMDLNGKPFKVVKFATNITDKVNKVAQILAAVHAAGKGDLTKELNVSGADDAGQIGEGLSKFFSTLRKSLSEIGQNAATLASSSEELTAVSQQMAGNAEETSAQSGVVSAASEQVSSNVQTVATGAEEMSASIKEIARNSSEAARVASEAVTVADTTNTTISKLGESSAEIGQVVKVITSIAEQTNLLALNATIEAARAGEAGKGFAVVANEVKDLANQTAKATEEISGKIGAIQTETQNSVTAIAEISEVINKINDISNTIASAVEEQTATTAEIGRNVSEAAKGTAEIAQNITGVAEAAQSTTQGATDTQAASTELSKMAAELQGLVGQFKV
jgi:methyl-accepting chemotaxis protein